MKLLIFLSYVVPELEQIIWCRIYELKVAKNVEKMPFFWIRKIPEIPGIPVAKYPGIPVPAGMGFFGNLDTLVSYNII